MSLTAKLKRMARRLRGRRHDPLAIVFVRRGGWLGRHLATPVVPPRLPAHDVIEARARATNDAGERPIWSGYSDVAGYSRSTEGGRTSDQVRTDAWAGRFYSWLVATRASDAVVEFGTAFGVSGMYWLAGLAGRGHLHTFDPNGDRAGFAAENLSAIGENFTLTNETFESAGPRLLAPGSIDVAFVDAIHTGAFVCRQYAVLRPLMKPGGLILFDDIDFSEDMQDCWREIASDPELVSSLTLGKRVGIVELP